MIPPPAPGPTAAIATTASRRAGRRAGLAGMTVAATGAAMVAGMLVLPGATAAPSALRALTTGAPVPPAAPQAGRAIVVSAPSPQAATSTPRTALPAAAVAANARIARKLALRVKAKRLGRVIGVRVVDAASSAGVWSTHAMTPYLPASNNKLVTAVTALTTMGASRRLATSVRLAPLPRAPRPTPSPTPTSPSPATTSPSPATTSATPTTTSPSPTTTTPTPTPTPTPAPVRTVHLVAGGDPLLTSANLRGLAETTATALKAKGSRTARVALDDTLFPSPTNGPGWRSGYVPDVVRPVRALVRDWNVEWDVAADAARYFTARLKAAGIAATYVGRSKASTSAPTIASYAGHTIGSAVTAMMLPSDNHIAEMLFRLSALATGRAATWAGASAAARSVLTSLQVPLAGVVLADGSGVSRADRLTPAALTTLLLRVADSTRYPKLRTLYYGQGMPVAGRTGTLSNRYRVAPSSCARGKVLAKTGTLHDVVALSGITPGADGRLKVFSVLVNAVPDSADKTLVRRAVDNLAATVTGCW